MKKAISICALKGGITGDRSVIDAAKISRKSGFDAVEANFSEKGEISLESSPAEIQGLLRKAKAEGVKICSLSTIILSKIDLISDKIEEREYARNAVLKMIDIASGLELPSVSLHCSNSRVCQKVSFSEAFERELEQIVFFAEKAKQKGVKYCVENSVQGILSSPNDFFTLIKHVKQESLGVCFDTGNSVFAGHPQRWIDTLGKYIDKIHFSDVKTRIMRGMIVEFVDIGNGEIDWGTTAVSLKKAGYNNYITIEAYANPNQDDETRLIKLCDDFEKVLTL